MSPETEFMLHSFLLGVYITFVYDLLLIFRRVIPHKGFWVATEDLFFWIYCAMEGFLLMYYESNGMLRWFAVMGAVVGMLGYKKGISPWFVKYCALGISKLLYPLRILRKWTKKGTVWAAGKRKKGLRFLKKKLTYLKKMLKMTLYK